MEGVLVYSTQKVLNVAREAETKPVAKRARGRPRKHLIEEVDKKSEEEILSLSFCDSDSSIDTGVARRTRSKLN